MITQFLNDEVRVTVEEGDVVEGAIFRGAPITITKRLAAHEMKRLRERLVGRGTELTAEEMDSSTVVVQPKFTSAELCHLAELNWYHTPISDTEWQWIKYHPNGKDIVGREGDAVWKTDCEEITKRLHAEA